MSSTTTTDETLKLASILTDLGAECCEKATLVDVLTQLGPSMKNRELQIARALFMMCIIPDDTEMNPSVAQWNASVFLMAVRETVIYSCDESQH